MEGKAPGAPCACSPPRAVTWHLPPDRWLGSGAASSRPPAVAAGIGAPFCPLRFAAHLSLPPGVRGVGGDPAARSPGKVAIFSGQGVTLLAASVLPGPARRPPSPVLSCRGSRLRGENGRRAEGWQARSRRKRLLCPARPPRSASRSGPPGCSLRSMLERASLAWLPGSPVGWLSF